MFLFEILFSFEFFLLMFDFIFFGLGFKLFLGEKLFEKMSFSSSFVVSPKMFSMFSKRNPAVANIAAAKRERAYNFWELAHKQVEERLR